MADVKAQLMYNLLFNEKEMRIALRALGREAGINLSTPTEEEAQEARALNDKIVEIQAAIFQDKLHNVERKQARALATADDRGNRG